jgi:hypothetical protein
MKKTVFKLLNALIAAVMILLVVSSCVGEVKSDTDTSRPDSTLPDSSTAGEGSNPANVDSQGRILDTVPTDTLDYGNKKVTILTWSDVEHEEFKTADQTGEPVNDAIYMRNLTVEERLGVNLQFISTPGNGDNIANWVKYVQNSIQAGDKTFDIMASYSLSIASTANAGYCYDLLDADCTYLNFNMPWWPDRLITEATINDKLYFCSGDISANALYMMYVCYVNNDIVKNMNLPNVFELVDNNKWTYAKFLEMCSGVYFDKDGSGTKTVGDQYGYMTSGIHCDPWFYGSGALIVDKDANGNLQMSPTFGGEKVINTLEMLNRLLYNTNDGIYTSSVQHQKEFNNGNILFVTDRARIAITVLISESLHFSIVPFPKYDEGQEKFVTVMGNPFTLYALPINASSEDLPMLSAVLETYASESYRKVTPALYETTLKIKYVQEADSARMYDIIRENLTFDLGRIFADVLVKQSAFRNAVANNAAGTWSSTIKGYSKVMPKLLEKIVTAYGG